MTPGDPVTSAESRKELAWVVTYPDLPTVAAYARRLARDAEHYPPAFVERVQVAVGRRLQAEAWARR